MNLQSGHYVQVGKAMTARKDCPCSGNLKRTPQRLGVIIVFWEKRFLLGLLLWKTFLLGKTFFAGAFAVAQTIGLPTHAQFLHPLTGVMWARTGSTEIKKIGDFIEGFLLVFFVSFGLDVLSLFSGCACSDHFTENNFNNFYFFQSLADSKQNGALTKNKTFHGENGISDHVSWVEKSQWICCSFDSLSAEWEAVNVK